MSFDDYSIRDLLPEVILDSFTCTESDQNDFLINDANGCQQELLAKTYLFYNEKQEIVAYFSLLNDVIRLNETEKRTRNLINRKIPYNKQRSHYPAVKIGRLAVGKDYSHNGIGTFIVDNIKYIFTHGNRTGCRFLTVDALSSATAFYEHNGFRFFTDKDENDYTRLMYFDLKSFQ